MALDFSKIQADIAVLVAAVDEIKKLLAEHAAEQTLIDTYSADVAQVVKTLTNAVADSRATSAPPAPTP